jgi:putative transposase
LSTRNYGAVVKDFHQAYGVEKSAVSDNFIASIREKLQELMERPLDELRLCAVLIDGTPFRDRQMIVALGINVDGRKTVLGLREGATENAAVVSELLGDLAARGLDFKVPSVRARRRQSAGGGGAPSCRRGRDDPTMSSAQAA